MSANTGQWINDLLDYCRKLNIELEDLYKVLSDPKVAPMVRGKAFEFSVSVRLSQVLPSDEWTVSKPTMNAQSGTHDVDVKVLHNATETVISVECKLAKKGGFTVSSRAYPNRIKGDYIIPVKCMRSRTTKSPKRVEAGAKNLGVSPDAFLAHSDQYRSVHFDVVITTVANAFYETDEETDSYVFRPNEKAKLFLDKFNPPEDEEGLQLFVYNKIYLARSVDLIASPTSGVVCGKQNCTDKVDCGFIPNYPLINFGNVDALPAGAKPVPQNHWIDIEDSLPLFESFIPTT